MNKLVTIGAYGYTEASFFDALKKAKVDTFVDVRQRRALRGPKYAFLNSQRLQAAMQREGIRYVYVKELAPTSQIRDLQKDADNEAGESKASRERLSDQFADAYKRLILDTFDVKQLEEAVGPGAQVVALFCVERRPEQCHRSLAAENVSRARHLPLEHLVP